MISVNRNFTTKIFADGAEKSTMIDLYRDPIISGLTTNPTLMHKAGIRNYEVFAKDILQEIKDKPISFEVFSDDLREMERQARKIASWASNVYVKIPITNTQRVSCTDLIRSLSEDGIKLNITAIMTLAQVESIIPSIVNGKNSFISVFAGRIADSGVDPIPVMKKVLSLIKDYSNMELIWSSPREILNIVQADEIGCHIITVTVDILKKLNLIGKPLDQFSLETVKMFYNDALSSGFEL